jgi:hypothetical protein
VLANIFTCCVRWLLVMGNVLHFANHLN